MIEAHRKKSVLRQQRTNRFAQKLADYSIALRRGPSEILQVNVGKLCNLTCVHCHVNAGPKRKEIMSRETIDRIIDWFGKTDIPTIDLTGGAPEMIPDFCYFIKRVKELHPSPNTKISLHFLRRTKWRSSRRCRATRRKM